jgi:hypothetical protein
MTPEKYEQLWNDLILDAINKYLKINRSYKFTWEEDKFKERRTDALKEAIWEAYEKDYKPEFKNEYMADKSASKFSLPEDDKDNVDKVFAIGGKEVKIDRHKVAALLYLAIVSNKKGHFIKLKTRDNDNIASILACHEIAYNVALNCIHCFIKERYNEDPNKYSHLKKILNILDNKGFKSPDLICEEYASYKDSLIPRMVWLINTSNKNPGKLVHTLANTFYFLELYSAL